MEILNYFPAMHLVCGNDELRPVFNHVLVTKELIVATNAHVMVWHKTELFFDSEFMELIPVKGFLIHKEDWKKFTGASFLVLKDNFIEVNYPKKRSVFIKPEINGEGHKYPEWKNVVPDSNDTALKRAGINPGLLVLAQKAIGTGKNNLALHFTGEKRAILLRSTDDTYNSYKNAAGLLMPVVYNYDLSGAEKELAEAKEIVNA